MFGYVTRLRLRHAAGRLVAEPHLPVTEVALEVGYQTPSAFNRVFRAVLGVSPTRFRTASPAQRRHLLTLLEDPRRRRPMKLDLVMTPEIRERAKRPFLHVTRHGVCAEQSPGAWEELHRILAIHPVTEPDAEYIGASFNDSHSPGDGVMRYDAGVVVPGTKPPPGLALGTVAGGRYAVFRYRGSYRHIWNAMDQIFRGWAARNSDTLRNAPLLEIYLNDPRTTPEKDLLTDLCVPVM